MVVALVGGQGFAVDEVLVKGPMLNKQRSVPDREWRIEDVPARATQAVRDYLDTRDAAFGAAAAMWCRSSSHRQDPAAQWTGALRGLRLIAYANNYLIDTANAVIMLRPKSAPSVRLRLVLPVPRTSEQRPSSGLVKAGS